MNPLSKPIIFIATANATNCRHFYENVLNFPCVSDDAFALVFDLGGNMLRVQKVASVPEVHYTVLGWEVLNIRECVTELRNNGVQFETFTQLQQDDLALWCSPSGATIAWFKDPDGNTLSVTEV